MENFTVYQVCFCLKCFVEIIFYLFFQVNRDVNVDDTIALLPNQKIILSLNYDSYYKLGIVGAKSILNKNKILTPKYRVEICLNKSYFKPEKKNYQRTYECLKRSQLAFDFIIKWDPTDSCISSNSLENYFNFLKENSPSDRLLSNMTIEKCVPTLRTFKNSSMPVLCSDDVESMTDDYLRDFIDWVGAQVAQVNCVDADYEISTFDFGDRPADSNIYCAELKGFFTSTNITKLRDILKPLLSSDEQNALIVHGFVDSPQCWTGTNNEHYKNISGENLYGIGRLNNQMAISWCLTDEYDFGIEKL